MDIELEYEEEREKNNMQLKVDDIVLEIPEEIINEREHLLHFSNIDDNINDLINEHKVFLKCFLRNEKGFNDNYNKRFIEYLNSELNIYR